MQGGLDLDLSVAALAQSTWCLDREIEAGFAPIRISGGFTTHFNPLYMPTGGLKTASLRRKVHTVRRVPYEQLTLALPLTGQGPHRLTGAQRRNSTSVRNPQEAVVLTVRLALDSTPSVVFSSESLEASSSHTAGTPIANR